MRPLLIGQAPGPNTDPTSPLHPHPASATGARLAALMGLTPEQYMATFTRINLLNKFPGSIQNGDRFPIRTARTAAEAIRPLLAGRTVILVGRSVARAFGHQEVPFHEWHRSAYDYKFSVVPHASGRNHWYNHVENRELSKAFWRALINELAGQTHHEQEDA